MGINRHIIGKKLAGPGQFFGRQCLHADRYIDIGYVGDHVGSLGLCAYRCSNLSRILAFARGQQGSRHGTGYTAQQHSSAGINACG